MPISCKKCVQRRTLDRIRTGRLPRPNDVACVDCGHVWDPLERGAQFHRYDHPAGYAPDGLDSIDVVCRPCQRVRQRARGWL